ncbi:hypothetical protein F4821DRAFT_255327 [Hypoxylon rubiginosum]|uniref:Uncharacterized protein n=1 Tax=Hypoxylon rubiginosum TaxID=110542 RepID=A0ACC0DEY4_9PEZI|nr:hypothetical protein F4821DRAFT_255327 [Hypoxylon rubiginosum]
MADNHNNHALDAFIDPNLTLAEAAPSAGQDPGQQQHQQHQQPATSQHRTAELRKAKSSTRNKLGRTYHLSTIITSISKDIQRRRPAQHDEMCYRDDRLTPRWLDRVMFLFRQTPKKNLRFYEARNSTHTTHRL